MILRNFFSLMRHLFGQRAQCDLMKKENPIEKPPDRLRRAWFCRVAPVVLIAIAGPAVAQEREVEVEERSQSIERPQAIEPAETQALTREIELDLRRVQSRIEQRDDRVLVPLEIAPEELHRLEVLRLPRAGAGEVERPPEPVADRGEATERMERVILEEGKIPVRRGEWTLIRQAPVSRPYGSASEPTPELSPDPPFGEIPSELETVELSREKHYLAGQFLWVDEGDEADEEAKAELVVREAKPFVRIAEDPLPWLHDDEAYGADLIFGLDSAEPGVEVETPVPSLPIVLTTKGATIPPEWTEVILDKIGANAYVPLRANDHRLRPAVTAWIGGYAERSEATIQANLTRMEVIVPKQRILGFGLEKVTFTVERYAEDDNLLAAKQLETVSMLGAGAGARFPSEVEFQPGSDLATGELSSTGMPGLFSLHARRGGVQSDPEKIQIVWPWLVTLMTLAGGLGGAAVRLRLHPEESQVVDYLLGVFSGVVLVAAVISGIVTFDPFPIPGEEITALGALVLAAAGGYAGRDVFEMLVRRLGLAKPEARAVSRDRPPQDPVKNDK